MHSTPASTRPDWSGRTARPDVLDAAYRAGADMGHRYDLVDVSPGDSTTYRIAVGRIGAPPSTVFDPPALLVSIDDGTGRWSGVAWRGTAADTGRVAECLAGDQPWTRDVIVAVLCGWCSDELAPVLPIGGTR